MNEKWFSANMLWLAESEFGKRDEARPGLCVSQWLQFCLEIVSRERGCNEFLLSYRIEYAALYAEILWNWTYKPTYTARR